MRVQPQPKLPCGYRALAQKLSAYGKRRARRKRERAHRAERGVVILGRKAAAILNYLVNGLYHAVRRQPAVFFGKIHAAPARGKAHANLLRRGKLLVYQKMARFFGENIMMVERRGAAPLHKLRHCGKRGIPYNVAVYPLPYLIERHQPVKKLHVLHLRQVP